MVSLREVVKDSPLHRAIVELLFASGVRVTGLVNIKLEDINWEERSILIKRGKKKKDRIVLFTAACREVLKEYLAWRKQESPFLFKGRGDKPLDYAMIDYYFKQYSKKVGFKVTLHMMRYTFATTLAKPGQELTTVELLDRELDPKYLLDKAARLDILARTAAGALINAEVQLANKYNIDKRTLFYWAGLYYGQLSSGQDFICLRKTITINILGFEWFKGKTKYHHTFRIREDETGELLNDELEIHFLELPKVLRLKRRPKDALEEWLLYFNNIAGEEMEAIAMGNPGIRKAMTIEQIFFKNQQERRLYELREKAARDEISMISGARAEGKAKGQREAICKYLDARFPKESVSLQAGVQRINDLVILDKIINKIYTVNSLDEATAIIREATQK